MERNAESDLAATARAVVDSSLYMTLGTADEAGLPWVTPVYFAHAGYSELFWVSAPDARHSRNLAARPQLGIVIFDSHSPIGAGRGVYMSAAAEQLTESPEVERGLEVFSQRSVEHGAAEWTLDDIRGPATLRLYRALASEQFVLGGRDARIAVTLG